MLLSTNHFPPAPSQLTEVSFILLTFFLVAVTLITVRKFSGGKKTTLRTFLIIFFWLTFLRIYSGMSFLHNYESLPPRLFLAPLGCIIAIVILTLSKSFGRLLKKIPLHWLIYIQAFRIVMELILFQLSREEIIPTRMSFEGWNFDVLVGLSALLIGWLVQKNRISKTGLLIWNFVGIALLLNITMLAALSTPYPFSPFTDGPVNTVIFYFPFIWLPGFVAPFALAMHIFSIKKLLDPNYPTA